MAPDPARQGPAPITDPPLRVLVADDVEITVELVQSMLASPADWSLEIAVNGEEALERAGAAAFDVILMDMHMPVLDGVEAARRIRAGRGPSRAAPIIAFTADSTPARLAGFRAAGADDHLIKPFTREELEGKLRKWGRRAQPAAPAAAAALQEQLRSDFGEEAFGLLLDKLARLLQGLILLCGDEPAPQISAIAHKCIGSAGLLGFTAASDRCRELEDACRGDGALAPALIAAQAACRRACADIEAQSGRGGPASA